MKSWEGSITSEEVCVFYRRAWKGESQQGFLEEDLGDSEFTLLSGAVCGWTLGTLFEESDFPPMISLGPALCIWPHSAWLDLVFSWCQLLCHRRCGSFLEGGSF